jgi:hypothetical protein
MTAPIDTAALRKLLDNYNTFGDPETRDALIEASWDALPALFDAHDRADELREILHDLVMCHLEQEATGGGPGWLERDAKAWARAEEVFEP